MSVDNIVNAQRIQKMVTHWLTTPPNRYLGSDYGCDAKALLQLPMGSNQFDAFLAKMRKDIPILQSISQSAINLFAEDVGIDKKRILIQIFDSLININETLGQP